MDSAFEKLMSLMSYLSKRRCSTQGCPCGAFPMEAPLLVFVDTWVLFFRSKTGYVWLCNDGFLLHDHAQTGT